MAVHQFPKSHKPHNRTPMDTALAFLAPRARSVREVERHLDEKQFGEFEVQQVIDRLLELDYLNDAAYAAAFIQSRLNTKPMSRKKLKEQLLAHELAREVVEEALLVITDEQEEAHALLVAQKHAAQLAGVEEAQRAPRLLKRMLGRGFSYEVSRAAIRQVYVEADLSLLQEDMFDA